MSADASLAALARRVRRLGVAGRTDPERILVEKDSIAHELDRLARAAPRPVAPADAVCAAPQRPAPMRPAFAQLAQERARRAEALARAQAAELERLRGLLAEAVRQPRRRRRAGADQLELPLP
jgi:hypothetical protein